MALVKMKILPQLLFIFHCVILGLAKPRIWEIQKMLDGFVWSGERLRCKNALLWQAKNREGWHSLTYGDIIRQSYWRTSFSDEIQQTGKVGNQSKEILTYPKANGVCWQGNPQE